MREIPAPFDVLIGAWVDRALQVAVNRVIDRPTTSQGEVEVLAAVSVRALALTVVRADEEDWVADGRRLLAASCPDDRIELRIVVDTSDVPDTEDSSV